MGDIKGKRRNVEGNVEPRLEGYLRNPVLGNREPFKDF